MCENVRTNMVVTFFVIKVDVFATLLIFHIRLVTNMCTRNTELISNDSN